MNDVRIFAIMTNKEKRELTPIDPATIPRFKKENYLVSLSEDDFRDIVVRPVMLRSGGQDGRDLCGPDEEGKDCIFIFENPLKDMEVWAVQTKKGHLNMSAKVHSNVVTAITQLETALRTTIPFPNKKSAVLPHKVLLCASGKMNKKARSHVCEQLSDPRIVILDSDELIPMIDAHYPEFWFGIDKDRNPYLAALRDELIRQGDAIPLSEMGLTLEESTPISDEIYLPLNVHHVVSKVVRRSGQVDKESEVEEFSVSRLVTRDERLILVLGDAGDGKTTALRKIAFDITTKALTYLEEQPLPIMVRCTELAGTQVSLFDYIVQRTKSISHGDKHPFSSADLDGGRLLLLIDALDEIPRQGERTMLLDRILQFHASYPKVQIILSSRPYPSIVNSEPVSKFHQFTLSSVDLKNTRALIDRLTKGRSLPSDASQEFMRQLQDIHDIRLNPLLITVFVATSDYQRRDIPANITELISKFVELMLGRWDQRKGLAQMYQAPLKDFLLQSVAIHMHSKQETVISIEEFKALIEEELSQRDYHADVDQITDELLYRSGLIRIDGTSLEFRHLLFQEYFAGRALRARHDIEGFLADDWWRKALVFYFGQKAEAIDELEELMKHVDTLKDWKSYQATVTLGLCIQASYLVKASERARAGLWVLRTLTRAYVECLSDITSTKYPMNRFLGYYIFARDSVAFTVIRRIVTEVEKEVEANSLSQEEKDVLQFWTMVSLMEAGRLPEAHGKIKRFNPLDRKLLIPLHFGAFMIQSLKITSREEKNHAKEICDFLTPKIKSLFRVVLEEIDAIDRELEEEQRQAIESAEQLGDG